MKSDRETVASIMKLKAKFTLIVSVLIAIFSLIALFAFAQYKKSIKDTIAQQQFLMISTLADEIDGKLLTAQQSLISVAKAAPSDIMQHTEKAQAFLDNRLVLHTTFDNNVLLFTPSGKLFVESPYIPGRRGLDLSFREYILNTLKTAKPYISDLYVSTKPPKHPVIIFTVPLFDGKGKIAGILGGSLDLYRDNFLGRLSNVKIGETGYLVLMAADRTMIMHPDRKRIMTKQAPGLNKLDDKAIEGFEGTGSSTTSYGVKVLSSYKRLKAKNWILIADYPQSVAYRPIRVAEQFVLMLSVIGIIAVFISIASIIKYLIKPLELFTRHVENLPKKTGEDRFWNISTKDEIGTLSLAFNKMVTEIDKRQELQDSEIRLRTLLKTIPDLIWLKDPDGIYLSCNETFERFFGAIEADIVGKTDHDFIDRALAEKFRESDRKAMATGKPISDEKWLTFAKDGYKGLFETAKAPMRDNSGNLIGVLGIAHDITERKRTETEKEQFYKFFQTSSDLMVIADPNGAFIKTNPACTETLGYSETELIAKPFIEFIHPEDKQRTLDEMAMQLQRGFSLNFENRYICKDGSLRWLSWRATYNKEEGNTYATARDITEKKMADLQLQEKEERIRTLSNNLPKGYVYQLIIEANGERRFTYISDGVESIHGVHASQVLDNPMVLYAQVDVTDRSMLLKAEEEACNKMATFYCEAKFITQDGKAKWLNICSSPRKLINGSTQFDGLVMDITDKKHIEEQLVRAQKMESIGQLAGGIAHDFNNMLTAIIGYGSLLNTKLGKDSELRPYVDQILSSAGRSADLTRQLLAFSRKQEIAPKETSLNNLIKGMEKLLSRLIGEDIELKAQLAAKNMIVMVDPGQIEQVLINLATNARDAMPDGGILSICASTVELDTTYVKGHDMEKPGMYAVISVSDTGKGIDEKTQQKIFEPFFTTKEVGKGTGLGLSIVYGIIKQHGGNITVYSEPGKGTTFRIYLPMIESKTEEVRVPEIISPKGGTETILFAEDNEDVRVLSKRVLEENGYTVVDAVDGEDAINKFKENRDGIQLIIIDVIMPKKSGKEAIDEIKKTKPDVKILFTSGYTSDIISRKGILEEGMDFISKPVTPHNLLTKIREILDK